MEQAKTNHRGGNRNRGIQEQTAIDCINLHAPWFEYAGDYCGIDAPVRVRCKKCGSELVRSMVTIRMGQATCSVCREAERNARRKAKQEAEAEERARKESERHKSVELIPLDSGRGFQLNHRKGDIESEITIVNKEFIESPAAMKLFVFLLIKAAQQNFPPIIEFPLKELVAREMYSNTSNARAGVEKQMIAVKSLQIGGKFKKYKRFIDQSSGVLFYHHKIKQNTVYVYCDGEINIEFLASYYTMLPAWSFSLSNNAFLLTLYIFMRARTDRKSNLNISYRAIRDVLALPTKEEYAENGKKFKPDQYVKQPITRAINEIVTAAAANSSDIKITAHDHIPGKQLEDWLNGYIEITVPKEFKKTLAEIKKNQAKRIEANTRKKE